MKKEQRGEGEKEKKGEEIQEQEEGDEEKQKKRKRSGENNALSFHQFSFFPHCTEVGFYNEQGEWALISGPGHTFMQMR